MNTLKSDGIGCVHGFLDSDKVAELVGFLISSEGYVVGENFSKVPAFFHSLESGLKLQYPAELVMSSPTVSAMVASDYIRGMAAHYLGCEPIFTGATAWWSLADSEASAKDLNWAAQQFHYDYDWPAFVKFFVYLTDVNENNGPFTFVCGSHERKKTYSDGRLSDLQVDREYGHNVKQFTGKAGDLIIADTAGYHKGMRVEGDPRLLLQLEFAVSRFGASAQYDLLPQKLLPCQTDGHTFDVFAL